MIATLSDQGLTFAFQLNVPEIRVVGSTAQLDFDWQGQHFSCHCLFVHVQGSRALVSLREAPAALLAALHSVNRHNTPPLAAGLLILQKQQACHARFMGGMKAVVEHFYRMLPDEIQRGHALAVSAYAQSTLAELELGLTQLRPTLTRQFTQTYPMYPEQRASYSGNRTTGETLQLVDMDQVDDWVCRSGIAHRVTDALSSLPEIFSHRYSQLLKQDPPRHPYRPESVMDVLADLIAPLQLGMDERILCYELMGKALQKEAMSLYQALLEIVGDVLPETQAPPVKTPDLAEWLRASAQQPVPGENETEAASTAHEAQFSDLTALVFKLTESLGELATRQVHVGSVDDLPYSSQTPIPALLARDRIRGRFAPAVPSQTTGEETLNLQPDWMSAGKFSASLGGLTSLDSTELDGLYAQLTQPPPIEPGPEKLSPTSQVRVLMLQAQGLLLEYTLNGLTYQAQPDHPAWTLINALDALHRGADDHGQFLNPALNHATSLAMQWLLGQENTDAALLQINAMLAKINERLLAERQSRREHCLSTLGEPESSPSLINTGWCVIKHESEAIPHEVIGIFKGNWALLNRSGTQVLEIPAARFIEEFDQGLIDEANSFDEPFLDRIANASLTASLNAVHAYTWQDPGSGCLKRSALMDELERRLVHPVTEPPVFCALVEVPTMRPGLASLPGDELAVMQKRTGEILLEMLEPGERCGRLSDVSFLAVFSPQDPHRLADRLVQLKATMEGLHPEWKMIGAVVPLVADEPSPTPSSVLRRANQACAAMRLQAGFDSSCLETVPPAVAPMEDLPFSSLYLRCQKIAPCDEGAPSHYEILLGVQEDLTPSHTTQSFVVMAEQSGRIQDLDAWVLRSALEWMDQNADGMEQLSGLSVNLSGNTLALADHMDALVGLLSRYPHLTKKLILEVTETAAIDNLEVAVRSLRKLRKLGCRVALDDFGSGYSSYGYLRTLPLDYLKIDGTYIRNILSDKTDQALTASMVDVAHALGLKVIAEYVDSEATYSWLKDLGVDYAQGYWVHKPERLDTLLLH